MNAALQSLVLPTNEPGLAVSYPDYIVAKLRLDGRSQRWLADETGISRSRMQRLLCADTTQRKPLRLAEQRAIFAALSVDQYSAALAIELMASQPEEQFEATLRLASMLAQLFDGLAGQVSTAIRHIEGFDYYDIRDEYGRVMKAAVVRTIERNFREIATRRGLRLDQLLAGDASY